jgi:hypothetical protein
VKLESAIAALWGAILGAAILAVLGTLGLRMRTHAMGLTGAEVQRQADACIAQHQTWTPVYDEFGVAVLAIQCGKAAP